MRSLLNAVLLVSLATEICGVPYNRTPLQRRNGSSTNPIITTTIHAANGTEVTSSFHTMVYWQQDTIVAPNANLTDRQVNTVRRINTCRSHSARFVQSHCAHSVGHETSLLEFVVYCQESRSPRYNIAMGHNPHGELLEPLVTTETGACEPHEICVNDMPPTVTGQMMATCVDTNGFLRNDNPSTTIRQGSQDQHGDSTEPSEQGPSNPGGSLDQEWSIEAALTAVNRALGNRRASVVISGPNGTMPLGVRSLEVDTGAESGGKVQQQTCSKCFGLRTQEAAANADFLSTKVTLMATTALTGLVWVTVFSG